MPKNSQLEFIWKIKIIYFQSIKGASGVGFQNVYEW